MVAKTNRRGALDSYLEGAGVADTLPGPEMLPKLFICPDDVTAGMRSIDEKTGGFSIGLKYLRVPAGENSSLAWI